MQNSEPGRSKMTTKNDATDGGTSAVEETRAAVIRLLGDFGLDLSDDLPALDRVIKAAQLPNPDDFEARWAQMEALGYRYGEDALEQVRFGWDLALGATPPPVYYGPNDPERELIRLLADDCGVDIGADVGLLDRIIALGAQAAVQQQALATSTGLTTSDLLKAQGFDGPQPRVHTTGELLAGSPHFCAHANEVPTGACPCGTVCYCRGRTCATAVPPVNHVKAAGEPLSDGALAKLHAEICQHASQDWSGPEETFTSQSELRVWDVLSLLNEVVASRAASRKPYSLYAAIVELLLRNPNATLYRLMVLAHHLDDRLRRMRPMLRGRPFEDITKDEFLELVAKIERTV